MMLGGAPVKRANIFVAAARWLKGGWNGSERRNPWTGHKEVKLGARGNWFDPNADSRPRATNASQHPKPPRQMAGMAARAIGTGRIGVGERVGVGRGTELSSESGNRAGPGGAIGMRIGVHDERGSASGGGSSSGS